MNEEFREAIGAAVRATLESCMANYQLAPMLTLEEIAERTQVSKDTIRAAVDSGDLRVYQISSRLPRFRVTDVNAWIDRLAVTPSPAEQQEESLTTNRPATVEEHAADPAPLPPMDENPEETPEAVQAAPEAPAPEAEQPAAPVDEKPADPKPEVQPEEPAPVPPAAEAPEAKPEEPADPWLAANDGERCPKCAPDGRRCILRAGHEAAGLKHRLIKKEN